AEAILPHQPVADGIEVKQLIVAVARNREVLVANPKIQRQAGMQAPGVLNVSGECVRVQTAAVEGRLLLQEIERRPQECVEVSTGRPAGSVTGVAVVGKLTDIR